MKPYVVIAVVLGLLALTQAQDDNSAADYESGYQYFGRPGRRPFGIPYPRPNEYDALSDYENSENIQPIRIPIYLDINLRLGRHHVYPEFYTTTAAPPP